jgi:hypothetical protein
MKMNKLPSKESIEMPAILSPKWKPLQFTLQRKEDDDEFGKEVRQKFNNIIVGNTKPETIQQEI